MFEKFGRISPAIKPAVINRALTGDNSASNNMQEAEIHGLVLQIVLMEPEDPNTIVDLREVKHSETQSKFGVKFINEDLGVAVDDRPHNEVVHMAKAISIRDLHEQVAQCCPPDAPIPSEEWLRLQCWPKTPKAKVSMYYTGKLNVRFMVPKRHHEDVVQQSFDTCVSMLLSSGNVVHSCALMISIASRLENQDTLLLLPKGIGTSWNDF